MWQEGTELTIKESKIAPFYFPSVIFLAWAFFSGITYFDSGYDDAMLFWGLAVLGISVLWVLIRGKKKPIIVSKEGIRLAEKGLVEWNRIKYTYPKSRKTGKVHSRTGNTLSTTTLLTKKISGKQSTIGVDGK